MLLPRYPLFEPINLGQREEIRRSLSEFSGGVSEFTFANLYLFRQRYNYTVSLSENDTVIISGERDGKKFFMTPLFPGDDTVRELLLLHDCWKNIPKSLIENIGDICEKFNIILNEDRNNFDYLYLREDLSLLTGKKFHKKRNLVNSFLLSYPEHSEKIISKDSVNDALVVLDKWKENKHDEGDYIASREALLRFEELYQEGMVFYVGGHPAGYCLGEPVAGNTMFALHFEKGLDEYKGIYQYINQKYAQTLNEIYTYINREQDLGDEGLRQAKETYRPCGFVEKYVAVKKA